MAGKDEREAKLTVDGIDVPFDKEKLFDARVTLMMGDLEDPTLGAVEKMPVQSRLMRFIFGDERDVILDKIAEKNGGKLDADALHAWWIEFLTAANAKN